MAQPPLPLLASLIILVLPDRLDTLPVHRFGLLSCLLRRLQSRGPFLTEFAKGTDLRRRAAFEPERGLCRRRFAKGEWPPEHRLAEGVSCGGIDLQSRSSFRGRQLVRWMGAIVFPYRNSLDEIRRMAAFSFSPLCLFVFFLCALT